MVCCYGHQIRGWKRKCIGGALSSRPHYINHTIITSFTLAARVWLGHHQLQEAMMVVCRYIHETRR